MLKNRYVPKSSTYYVLNFSAQIMTQNHRRRVTNEAIFIITVCDDTVHGL